MKFTTDHFDVSNIHFLEIKLIKLFISWNGYPSYTRNSVIKHLRNNTNTNINEKTNDEKKIIWVRLPYLGHVEDEMRKRCFKKVQKRLPEKICCLTLYEMKNLAMIS